MSDLIEQSQYALGEGPCVDAFRQDWPVLEPDLANPDTSRWPAFSPPAVEAGVRAVFGFPLQVGAARLGALNLCCDRRGAQRRPARRRARDGGHRRPDHPRPAGGGRTGRARTQLEQDADFHYAVNQAAGMVAAQLEVSVAQALVRLRACAFGNDRPLTQVAKDVVERRLRLGTGDDDNGPGA